MKPTLTAISGLGGKGPACFLVEAAGARLLLDLGYGPQPGHRPDVSRVGRVDALLLSHGHRDHAGALDLLTQVGNPPVYATDIVRRQLPAGIASYALPLHGACDVCGIRVTTGRNGHAPGGVWMRLDVGDGLLYTGDLSVESAVYAYDPPPAAGTLLLDGSYGAYDTALGDVLPAFDELFAKGPVLLPVPPAGRAADIALHVLRRGLGYPYVDGAVRSALTALACDSRECVRSGAAAEIEALAERSPPLDGSRGIMLAAAADATSGEAAQLAARWEDEAVPQIVFTGYVPPGTPAERLTRSGRARHLRWNVHPRLSDAVDLARRSGARTVLPAFGEARHLDTWRAAFGPATVVLQDRVTL